MRNVCLGVLIAISPLLFTGSAQGQNLDSLESLLTQELADTTRVNILTSIGESMRYSSSEKMYQYSTEAKNLSSKIGYDQGLVKALYNLTTYFETYRNDDSVQYYFKAAINLAESIGDETTYISLRNAWGLYLVSKRQFDEAQEIFYELLRSHEVAGNAYGQMGSLNNIGLVFMELHQYEEAIANFKTGLTKVDPPHPVLLSNIGSCYGSLEQIDSATRYIDWAMQRSICPLKNTKRHSSYFWKPSK
jgi:tetratricopeptide (TPR) repeat protein